MAIEIERKFLIKNGLWRDAVEHFCHYRQGYLIGAKKSSVRVRVAGDRAWLNIKGATLGVVRAEYEYEIPVSEANEMLENLCEKPLIEKVRYTVPHAGHVWEVDVFEGENEGLVVAEIELTDECEAFEKPEWVADEVSDDPRYYNVCLIDHPYSKWKMS